MESSEPDGTSCCQSKSVPSSCLGLCKTQDHPVDYDNIVYPNFCDLFKSEIDECWKEFYGNMFIHTFITKLTLLINIAN